MNFKKLDKIKFKNYIDIYQLVMDSILRNSYPVELYCLLQWTRKVFDYNIINGKNVRIHLVVKMVKFRAEKENRSMNVNDWNLVIILGWINDFLNSSACIIDDIMNQSITRRGLMCWYKLPGVGLSGINDGILIYQAIYKIIRLYFHKEKYYMQLIEEMHKASYLTYQGQCMDMLSNPGGEGPQFKLFTLSNYLEIVKYKITYYSLIMPMKLAQLYSSNELIKDMNSVEVILIKMGYISQVNDDFCDCFLDESLTGKIGTDIQDGKCSWIIIQALSICSQRQLEILKGNYGKKGFTCVARVKSIFTDINIKDIFNEEKSIILKDISKRIEELKHDYEFIMWIYNIVSENLYQ